LLADLPEPWKLEWSLQQKLEYEKWKWSQELFDQVRLLGDLTWLENFLKVIE
jgi:hypothetical protein